ncbi:MAG: LysR family transcriptional regulator [Hyphomicrobiaceae bacterium]|nr:LysR family transcriptional regulator [Hyphomicrobiaceae bacterium]
MQHATRTPRRPVSARRKPPSAVAGPAQGGLKLRIDFGPFGALGRGKIALMEGIARHGSISAAGKDLGMSYRRAWELADEINHIFAEPLIEKQTGGAGGGGARLSRWGAEVVQRFRAIEEACASAALSDLAVLRANLPVKPRSAA